MLRFNSKNGTITTYGKAIYMEEIEEVLIEMNDYNNYKDSDYIFELTKELETMLNSGIDIFYPESEYFSDDRLKEFYCHSDDEEELWDVMSKYVNWESWYRDLERNSEEFELDETTYYAYDFKKK
jgi:hypothetical protein